MCAGRRIIPKGWVRDSTRAHVFGPSHEIPGWETGSSAVAASYGYFWWLGHASGCNFHFAIGVGGQMIFLVHFMFSLFFM